VLSKEDNELLCRTSAGTPMGELFRRFWLPALVPAELPRVDSDPIRFRILGENLIAFRDTTGRVGFIDEHCPHRGASLFFGRNEEAGLRCVYHGWKFDVDGQCVDMPNEPAESDFRTKVRARTYPSAEFGGLIWIYMGPVDKQPPLPRYRWIDRPGADESTVQKWMQESNYAQALEGNVDSSHVNFLHRTFGDPSWQGAGLLANAQRLTVGLETEFGFVYGARRDLPNGDFYWRGTPFTMPTGTQIPGSRDGSIIFLIPRDDESHWWYTITPPAVGDDEPDAPMRVRPSDRRFEDSPFDPQSLGLLPGTWRRIRNRDNDYLIDREAQRTYNYTGLPGARAQDQAVTESMGAIFDRSREHLGRADTAIIIMRRMLLRMARELEQGIEPELVQHPERFSIVPINLVTKIGDFGTLWNAHSTAFKASRAAAT
jgi:nitrite reductase/ring-hydroxylating ferredoxin subunit